jgi:hypothetical protein
MTSACTLPCALEGAACSLMGQRALLIVEDGGEAGAALAASLRLLGLEVLLPGRARTGAPILPPRVDLLLASGAGVLRRASDLIGLLREERPWVPMILARPDGMAVLLDAERGLEAPPSGAGDLSTLIVRAVCRTARHHPAVRSMGLLGRAGSPPLA